MKNVHVFPYEHNILEEFCRTPELRAFLNEDFSESIKKKFLDDYAGMEVDPNNKTFYYDLFEKDLRKIGFKAENNIEACIEDYK